MHFTNACLLTDFHGLDLRNHLVSYVQQGVPGPKYTMTKLPLPTRCLHSTGWQSRLTIFTQKSKCRVIYKVISRGRRGLWRRDHQSWALEDIGDPKK